MSTIVQSGAMTLLRQTSADINNTDIITFDKILFINMAILKSNYKQYKYALEKHARKEFK